MFGGLWETAYATTESDKIRGTTGLLLSSSENKSSDLISLTVMGSINTQSQNTRMSFKPGDLESVLQVLRLIAIRAG